MSEESRMLQEIEPNEAWLREVMPPDAPPSMEPLKLRARVGVHEAWLARAAQEASPSVEALHDPRPPLSRLKRIVQKEIARQRRRRFARSWTLVAASFAAAAAVLFVVLPSLRSRSTSAAPVELALTQRVACFTEALAETASSGEQGASDWDVLESDLSTLEDALADRSPTEWGDWEIDDLDRELDALADYLSQGS
jgi:hypothetical protein